MSIIRAVALTALLALPRTLVEPAFARPNDGRYQKSGEAMKKADKSALYTVLANHVLPANNDPAADYPAAVLALAGTVHTDPALRVPDVCRRLLEDLVATAYGDAMFVVNEGESTWFEGLQLLALYALLGVVFYYA